MRANEILNEVSMTPKALRRQVDEIYGAIAGMEFEMIVPNAALQDEDAEQVEDYDYNPRVDNLSDISDFFGDGIYNDSDDAEQAVINMRDDYFEWASEQIEKDWQKEGKKFLFNYIEEHDWNEDDEIDAEFEKMGLSDEERANAMVYGKMADSLNLKSSSEYNKPIHSTPAAEHWRRGVSMMQQALDAKVEAEWEDQGRSYDRAKEEFDEEHRDDLEAYYPEKDWLRSENIRTMKDVVDTYSTRPNLTWPHWTEDYSGGGSWPLEDVAGSFSKAVGRWVEYSENYHDADRSSWVTDQAEIQDMLEDPNTDRSAWGSFVVEPDGSLKPDNNTDQGLEFISPPLPLALLLDELQKVKEWADEHSCYTGVRNGTGLHMNVSLLNLNSQSLDYVKLVLLLGDNYLLSEFERTANSYCKSTLKELESKVSYRPEQVADALATMKTGLNEKAGALIAKSSGGKFYSIHDQEGYIEFRSPGGDWLGDTFFNKIEDSLLRMVVAVDAACDPGKHDREYAKKLYKLLSPALRATKMEAFHTQLTQYLSGEMSEEKMAQFISSEKAARDMRKAKAAENDALAAELKPSKKYWWRVELTGSNAEIELVASSREEAIEWARVDWRMTSDNMRRNYPDNLFTPTPLRKYIEEPATPEETPPAAAVPPAETPPEAGSRLWVVVDATEHEVFNFWGRNDQGEANAEAARLLRTTYSIDRHRGPFEVYPIPT